jgi:hypothetical protein
MPEVTLVDAINLGLARALADDPNVVVFGEDVGVNGGVFPVTAGFRLQFADLSDNAPLASLIAFGELAISWMCWRLGRPQISSALRVRNMLEIVLGALVVIGLFVFSCDVTDSWNNVFLRNKDWKTLIRALLPPYSK